MFNLRRPDITQSSLTIPKDRFESLKSFLWDEGRKLNKVVLLTGPSGSGKKTVLNYIFDCAKRRAINPKDKSIQLLVRELKRDYRESHQALRYLTDEYFEFLAMVIVCYRDFHLSKR